MADKTKKVEENVKGRYYVDENCNACGLCSDEAPSNFKMKGDDAYAFVHKQPENEEEEQACRETMDSCPEEAIGDDG